MTNYANVIVLDTNTANIPRERGYFRPQYAGMVTYFSADEKRSAKVTPRNLKNLRAQELTFHFAENEEWADGVVTVDGVTGRTRVEIRKTSDFKSFQAFGRLKDACWQFLFDVTCAMGRMCYNTFIAKKHGNGKSLSVLSVADKPPITPAVVKVTKDVFLPKDGEQDETPDVIVDEDGKGITIEEPSETVIKSTKYKTPRWPRRGGYVTNKYGTVFWRSGGDCCRHALVAREEEEDI